MGSSRQPGLLDDPVAEGIRGCRSCGGRELEPILSLGPQPLADRLVAPDRLDRPDPLAPLELVLCSSCSLVQLDRTVPRELLFDGEYRYCSSASEALVEHARTHAEELIESRSLDRSSFVLEIASNDGYMLRNFVGAGIPALGVDPSAIPVGIATDAGIPTLLEPFDPAVARRIVAERGRADAVIANNVLAHVGDSNGMAEGIAAALAPGGVATLEVPYVLDLVDGNQFDTIYHQHLCYFSLTALTGLFGRHGLVVREAHPLPIHGGSVRVELAHGGEPGDAVRQMLAAETERGVDEPGAYRALSETAEGVRESLPRLLAELRHGGARIAAYGAAAKGTTLLGYCGLGAETLEFVVDRNPVKRGLYMPGSRLEIRDPDALLRERPDYALLLSWNFAEEILDQQEAYVRAGGRFVVPIPAPRIL